MPWYLRSTNDLDTHWGLVVEGKVRASCDAVFPPLRIWKDGDPALPGYPLDPAQICLTCKSSVAGGEQ